MLCGVGWLDSTVSEVGQVTAIMKSGFLYTHTHTHTHTLIFAGLSRKLLNCSNEFAINFVTEHFEIKTL